jgi:nicotinamidase-related amidase
MATRKLVMAEPDYSELARRPLRADRCTLLVVDLQEKLLPQIFEKERVLRNAQLLIRTAKILGVPALATTQYVRGLGPVDPETAELLPYEESLDKTTFSCFGHEPFCSALRALPRKRDTLLICGVESHICVMQTVLDALDEGYVVHVPVDAVSSRTELNWKIGIDRMRSAGAILSSTEMMIYELLRASDTPAFKEMLPHFRKAA